MCQFSELELQVLFLYNAHYHYCKKEEVTEVEFSGEWESKHSDIRWIERRHQCYSKSTMAHFGGGGGGGDVGVRWCWKIPNSQP